MKFHIVYVLFFCKTRQLHISKVFIGNLVIFSYICTKFIAKLTYDIVNDRLRQGFCRISE